MSATNLDSVAWRECDVLQVAPEGIRANAGLVSSNDDGTFDD
jgi:hypothetical protein